MIRNRRLEFFNSNVIFIFLRQKHNSAWRNFFQCAQISTHKTKSHNGALCQIVKITHLTQITITKHFFLSRTACQIIQKTNTASTRNNERQDKSIEWHGNHQKHLILFSKLRGIICWFGWLTPKYIHFQTQMIIFVKLLDIFTNMRFHKFNLVIFVFVFNLNVGTVNYKLYTYLLSYWSIKFIAFQIWKVETFKSKLIVASWWHWIVNFVTN